MKRQDGQRRPTVLQVIPELDGGGAERTTVEIAEAVVRAGGRALVVATGGNLVADIEAAGGEFVAMPVKSKNPAVIWSNAGRLARLIAAEGVGLIHARSRAPAWSCYLAARRARIPFVTTYHGAYSERGRLKNYYNGVMARGRITIANSRYIADTIAARYADLKPDVRTVLRGVDLARFDPAKVAPERIAALRTKWSIPDGAPVIAQVARLTPLKGQRVVIEALGRLKRDGRLGDAVTVFAGDAQGREGYVAELEDAIDRHGLQGAVRFAGHVSDVPAVFALAKVGLLVSTEPEGFGRSSIEAQAMACPVILSRIGALPETLVPAASLAAEPPATGWLVPPDDSRELADAIAAALAMPPGQRAAIGQRARAFATSNFSTQALQRATLAIYDELLKSDLAARFDAATAAAATPADTVST